MKERAYRIFILWSINMLICIMTAIWVDWTNCSALSQLPSKLSGSGISGTSKWPLDGMLVRIACAMDDAALVAALWHYSWLLQSWRLLLDVWSCMSAGPGCGMVLVKRVVRSQGLP